MNDDDPAEPYVYTRVPTPDPTKLTTDAVNAVTVQYRLDIESARKYLETKIDSLHELIDERTKLQDEALKAAFAAAKEAVDKAEAATEKRFQAVDKFRDQLADQAVNFMTRTEATVRIDGIAEKLELETTRTAERLRELELRVNSRLDLQEGTRKGTNVSMTMTIAAISVIVSLIIATIMIISMN